MFEKLIADTASCLKKHRIPYMIIGGQAVLLYGSPRLTKDIDITLGVSTEKLPLLLDVIKETELKAVPEDPEQFVAQTSVMPAVDRRSGIRVDFIFSFTPYEEQAIKRAKLVTVGGVRVKFATVEDIVIHKIFSGRARDLEDVRTILAKNPRCDMSYVRGWLKKFEASIEGKNFLGILGDIIRGLR
jgi:predicted nucleotidyltransferase